MSRKRPKFKTLVRLGLDSWPPQRLLGGPEYPEAGGSERLRPASIVAHLYQNALELRHAHWPMLRILLFGLWASMESQVTKAKSAILWKSSLRVGSSWTGHSFHNNVPNWYLFSIDSTHTHTSLRTTFALVDMPTSAIGFKSFLSACPPRLVTQPKASRPGFSLHYLFVFRIFRLSVLH